MSELHTLWLPLALAGLAVAVLLLDLVAPPHGAEPSGRGIGVLCAAGLAALLVGTFFIDASGTAAYGASEGGAWTLFFQRLFLAAAEKIMRQVYEEDRRGEPPPEMVTALRAAALQHWESIQQSMSGLNAARDAAFKSRSDEVIMKGFIEALGPVIRAMVADLRPS